MPSAVVVSVRHSSRAKPVELPVTHTTTVDRLKRSAVAALLPPGASALNYVLRVDDVASARVLDVEFARVLECIARGESLVLVEQAPECSTSSSSIGDVITRRPRPARVGGVLKCKSLRESMSSDVGAEKRAAEENQNRQRLGESRRSLDGLEAAVDDAGGEEGWYPLYFPQPETPKMHTLLQLDDFDVSAPSAAEEDVYQDTPMPYTHAAAQQQQREVEEEQQTPQSEGSWNTAECTTSVSPAPIGSASNDPSRTGSLEELVQIADEARNHLAAHGADDGVDELLLQTVGTDDEEHPGSATPLWLQIGRLRVVDDPTDASAMHDDAGVPALKDRAAGDPGFWVNGLDFANEEQPAFAV
eukprot:m51a1_g2737 hypothetical protein (359) ;mRNA; f:902755-904001